MRLLETIRSPADLRSLDRDQLRQLADELRAFVLESVSRTGGHLSSNLGTVELTIALHAVFETPKDRIVWDVGHQTYPHKILTGRREDMATLRQQGGISGFPRRVESEYDSFGTAHSSTSISAALGMAVASRNKGTAIDRDRRHIAVIGDGAMTAGMAFEALNNAGVTPGIDLLVILNDNEMSISPPVGALHRHLTRLMSGRFYAAAKRVGQKMLEPVQPLYQFAKRFEEHTKGMLVGPGTIFEEFGFNYLGPIDGHDLDALVETFTNLKARGGLQFLHVVTKKGAGYKLAEDDPVLYHGPPGRFDPAEGIKPQPPKLTYTKIFGDWLCDMAAADPRLIGITPAMREGSGMVAFEQRFPTRYFDVGIAEQHAVTFAGGLACEGLKPVVAIYSTFLQRGYDQLIHDIALQNLDVTFALDRAGLVGADGATHAGNYDLAYLRCLPNVAVIAPSDENECRRLLTTAFLHPGPAAVRYPRGVGPGAALEAGLEPLPWGRAQLRRESGAAPGRRIAVLAFGSMVAPSLAAAAALDLTVVDMRFVKPIDRDCVERIAATHDAIVTVEEGAIMGGAGSAVTELLGEFGLVKPTLQLGLPDRFIDHGEPAVLLAQCGLDAAGLGASIRKRFGGLLDSAGPKLVVSR